MGWMLMYQISLYWAEKKNCRRVCDLDPRSDLRLPDYLFLTISLVDIGQKRAYGGSGVYQKFYCILHDTTSKQHSLLHINLLKSRTFATKLFPHYHFPVATLTFSLSVCIKTSHYHSLYRALYTQTTQKSSAVAREILLLFPLNCWAF